MVFTEPNPDFLSQYHLAISDEQFERQDESGQAASMSGDSIIFLLPVSLAV